MWGCVGVGRPRKGILKDVLMNADSVWNRCPEEDFSFSVRSGDAERLPLFGILPGRRVWPRLALGMRTPSDHFGLVRSQLRVDLKLLSGQFGVDFGSFWSRVRGSI